MSNNFARQKTRNAEIIVPSQTITSNSQKAIIYRNMHRPEVDELFNERDSKIKIDGVEKYKHNRAERHKLDTQARNLWNIIIIESNKL